MSDSSLDQLYPAHLGLLMGRADRALAATGFDALVVHAGRPPLLFLDDQDYPYKVNPQFKVWVPIVDNPRSILVYRPGAQPTVLFHQPNDYWHKPAKLPTAPWTNAVNLIPLEDDSKAAHHWDKLGRAAFLGPENLSRAWIRNASTPKPCWRCWTSNAPSRHPMNWPACEKRVTWARAAMRPRSRHFTAAHPNTMRT